MNMTYQQKLIEQIKDWYTEEQTEFLSLLQDLVGINSFTNNIAGVNAVQDILQNSFTEIGLKVERFKLEGAGDFLKASTGFKSQAGSILLVGHSDTVHKPESDFCKFNIEGDKASGPGVLDMKSGLCLIVWALKALKELDLLTKLDITVLVVPDEEKGSAKSRDIEAKLAKDARSALVFEFGRDGGNVVTQRGGMGLFSVEAHGVSGHAGNDHETTKNAILVLADFIQQASALTNYDSRLTVNFGTVSGGSAVNVVPDFAEAGFEIRASNKKVYQEAVEQIFALAASPVIDGAKLNVTEQLSSLPMEETTESIELFESYQKCGQMVGLNYGKVENVSGGVSDANLISNLGIPTIDGLGPDGEFAHTEKEYMNLSSVEPKLLNLVLWLFLQAG